MITHLLTDSPADTLARFNCLIYDRNAVSISPIACNSNP